jgi:ubiquinone biosynthesis protein UbiJ
MTTTEHHKAGHERDCDGRTKNSIMAAQRRFLMALTLQKKLELAGDLAKVQPLLQLLRRLEKPKERHDVRSVILVSIGVGVVAAVVVLRRRGHHNGAVADDSDYSQADSPNEEAVPATE